MRIDKNTKIYLGQREIVKIKKGNDVIWEGESSPVVEPDYFYVENTYNGSNTITFTTTKSNSPSSDVYTDRIEYSKDKLNWTTLTFDISTPQTVTINSGEKLYMRNNSGVFNYDSFPNNYTTSIDASQSCILGGNINTLLDYNNANNSSLTGKSGCFYSLFKNNSHITDASSLVLPTTTLVNNYYTYMFQNCTSLTTPPELPANTLTLNCYFRMFDGCTSLTTAPALPATTLENYCYSYMFNGCTSLTTAPTLPATTLTNYCYQGMFNGCTSLNSVTSYAEDISASGCLENWLNSVAQSGTFNNFGLIEYPSGSSGIPTGWTEISTIQSISANPDTFTLKSYQTKVRCESTLTITTTFGTTVTKTNLVILTVGENTGDSTRTLTETIPYIGSSYQITIVQTANDPAPTRSWNVVSTGTYPFELNLNDYYESTNKEKNNSYSYATLNYSGFDNLVLECINSAESGYDYGIVSQPDVLLSESTTNDGATGSANVFHNFKGESSTTPVQLTIPSDGGSHFITIKFRKDSTQAAGNDSFQFRVVEPTT